MQCRLEIILTTVLNYIQIHRITCRFNVYMRYVLANIHKHLHNINTHTPFSHYLANITALRHEQHHVYVYNKHKYHLRTVGGSKMPNICATKTIFNVFHPPCSTHMTASATLIIRKIKYKQIKRHYRFLFP